MNDKPTRRSPANIDSAVVPINAAGVRRGMNRTVNGAGWGGHATGASRARRFSSTNQPTPQAKVAGREAVIAKRTEVLKFSKAVMRED